MQAGNHLPWDLIVNLPAGLNLDTLLCLSNWVEGCFAHAIRKVPIISYCFKARKRQEPYAASGMKLARWSKIHITLVNRAAPR